MTELVLAMLVLVGLPVLLLWLLLYSSRIQSLVAFASWINWPPFAWDDLARPSPRWAQAASALLARWSNKTGSFQGLATADQFSVAGSKGTVRGLRLPAAGCHDDAEGSKVVLYLHGNAGNIVRSPGIEFSSTSCCQLSLWDVPLWLLITPAAATLGVTGRMRPVLWRML
ncbi:unnamed protein product [Polarella glacialis]|uniref:Uncharacterized protein n=1 Tax=Polarella glacialis TaxID=89957 RepID=A0A813IT78_POLGL|nr:unnamed protein product [Polarella glacialis]